MFHRPANRPANHPTDHNIRHRSITLVVLLFLSSLIVGPGTCWGYSPEDPIVQKMVGNGVKFLENYKGEVSSIGEQILMAYAHFKVEHDDQVAIVKRGIAAAKGVAAQGASGKFGSSKANYELGVSVLLLAGISPDKYRPELEMLQQGLLKRRKPYGGYTYDTEQEGDISQTQYGMLGVWTLDRAGIPMDYAQVAGSLQWLLRVQDISGTWPYLAIDPGPGKGLIKQHGGVHGLDTSMALAGASSVLIAGDALRLWGDTSQDDETGIAGLPKAIKIFKEDTNRDRRQKVKMSKEPIFRAMGMMEAWRAKNPYKRSTSLDWYYYQIYTLERYESFIEIAKGAPKDTSPAWYNQTVDELRKYQDASGGWTDRSRSQAHLSTSFALLFLIRSTQKAIFTPAGGGAIGGQGFKGDISKQKLVDGKAVEDKPAQAVSAMLDMLDGEDGEIDVRSMAEAMELPDDPKARSTQLDRLERMVRGSRQWQARRVAAIVLGKGGEIRSVPSLIYALSDPDTSVRRYARDGLRMISRKFEGFGMSDDPDYAELTKAQDSWRDWYRSMDPGYVFLDTDL